MDALANVKIGLGFQLSQLGGAPHLERRADECNRSSEILKHQRGFYPHDAIAQTAELAITTRIRRAATRVIAAIHFDDEPDARSEEIPR